MASKTSRTSPRITAIAICSDSEDEHKENNAPDGVNVTKMSGYQTPLRKRTMSPGSVKKRRQISSDDEDENAIYTLGDRRNKASAEKIRRNLVLDKLKEKRESSAKRKVSGAQSDLADPTQSSLKENDKNNKVDVLKSQIDEDYSSSDDFEEHRFPQRRVGRKRLKSNYSSEDDESSQRTSSSEQGSDSDDFIVHDSAEDLDSQEIVEGGGVFFHLKPTLEEAHAIYVQVVLRSLLENDSSENESDPGFEQAKIVIEDKLWSKKTLVDSNAWSIEFKEMLGRYSFLEDTTLLSKPVDATCKCQACKRNRHITRCFSFYKVPQGGIVQEFRIGCYCADKTSLYHQLHHYCSFTLMKKCIEKLEEVKEMESTEDIVQRLCMEDEEWMNELFAAFKDLLNKADEWAIDGKEHRKMMRAVSSYM